MQPVVVIGIPTYRRPTELARLLDRLCSLALPANTQIRVVVVDNDPGRSAERVVAAAVSYPHELRYTTEALAGVCHVRNKVLDYSRSVAAELVAFIDDDGSPDPAWLTAATECLRRTGAMAVTGPLLPCFDLPVGRWLERAFSLCYVRGSAGVELREMSAGNLLLDATFLDRHGLRFEPALSTHGGEDTRLAQDIVAHGGKIAWAPDAVVVDHVPADRANLRWLLERWYRTGNTEAHLDLLTASGCGRRMVHVVRGLSRIVAGAALAVLALPSAMVGEPEPLARHLYTVTRGAGMIAAAFGSRSDHYLREPALADPVARSVAGDTG